MDFATATTQPAADSVEFDCNPTQAWLGWVRLGMAWSGMARQAWQGEAGQGSAWQGRRGLAGRGKAWQGKAGKAQTAAIERGISGSQTTNKNRK